MSRAATVERTIASTETADVRARLLEKGDLVFPREIPIRVIRVIGESKSRKELT